MTKQEFAKFMAGIKGFYPKENIFTSELVMDMWYEQLSDLEYSDVSVFLKKWVSTQKWTPSIAEIRSGVAELKNGELPDWGKAWEQVEKAIRNYGSYRVNEAYASMDELTRETAQRLGFLNICQSENLMTDRANFRMIYEELASRKQREQALSPQLKIAIEQKRLDHAMITSKALYELGINP